MLDNITLITDFIPPRELYYSKGLPFEYNGIFFSPNYRKGEFRYYTGELGNLRLFMFPDKIYLVNSLHKYFHNGYNYGDYYLTELKETIKEINEQTGINWQEARVTKLEYGCNILANTSKIINSLLSYKGKDYLPMHLRGKVYGKTCEFFDYKIKAYDKTFEVKHKSKPKVNLEYPLFRWEIAWNRMRTIENLLNYKPLQAKHLLIPETLHILAKDAVKRYVRSIRNQMPDLYKLEIEDKRVLAAMLVSEIKESLRINHNRTFLRYQSTYLRIMNDESICLSDQTKMELMQKLEELIHG